LTRVAFDAYPTPHSIVGALLSSLDWLAGKVWEPCAGDGRVVAALQAKGCDVVSHDIQTGHDFFDWSGAQAPILITNPPFGPIRRFIDHAFEIGVERMALVCGERLWACRRGQEQFERHRPARFVNLSWREDYLNKGRPDRALAISIWDTPHAKACRYEIWQRDG
jgi:hypothetical protein